MIENPVGLARPLLVIAGWRAPRWPSQILAHRLGRLVGGPDNRVAAIAFPLSISFDDAVPRIATLVDQLWPSSSAEETTEIDAVGISMGGLIGRAAAIGAPGAKRLRLNRLFTLGTPHRGARAAPFVPLDRLAREMRAGSPFIARLDESLAAAPYELVCYSRLHDTWVGARNTAPPAHNPLWTPGPLLLSHQTISADPLIRADIARRLRNEPPLALRGSRPPRD